MPGEVDSADRTEPAILANLEVLVLAVLTPLLLFPRPGWVGWALVLPVIWIIRAARTGRFLAPSPLNLLLVPLLLMGLVSTWATPDLEFSRGKLSGTLLGVLTLFAGAQWIRTRARLSVAALAFLGIGAALAGFSLLATPFTAKFRLMAPVLEMLPSRLAIPVPEGSLNPNPIGGTLILLIPLLLAGTWGLLRGEIPTGLETRWGRWWKRLTIWGGLGCSSLSLGVLLLTQSRGAWAGLAAAGAFLLALRIRWMGRVLVVLVGVGVLATALYLWQAGDSAGDSLHEVGTEIGLAARLEIWNRAIYGIQDFAFTGMGMNSFRKVVHLLYPLFLLSPDQDIASAHNQWLQTALDLGIPGLVAYVALWAAVFRLLWLAGKAASSAWARRLAAGLAAGLFAQFIYLAADAVPLGAKLGIFWWAAVTLAAALFQLECGPARLGVWATGEVLLMWVLIALASIGLVGDHPYVALGLAGAGGVYLGWLATRGEPGGGVVDAEFANFAKPGA